MTAQINLYHACFRKQHLLLPFSRMLLVMFLATLGIPAMVGLNSLEVNKITAETNRLKENYYHLEQEWQKNNAILSQKNTDPKFAAQAAKLETIMAHRNEILKFIKENGFQKSTGYSDYLIALSRQHTKDIWLTNISILKNGANISIEGKMNDSATLPLYLKRLATEPLFAGTEFMTLKITRDSDENSRRPPLSFMITSSREFNS
jgi:hypothetical protein